MNAFDASSMAGPAMSPATTTRRRAASVDVQFMVPSPQRILTPLLGARLPGHRLRGIRPAAWICTPQDAADIRRGTDVHGAGRRYRDAMIATVRRVDWRDVAMDAGPSALLLVVGLLDIATGLSQPTGSASPTTAVIPTVIVCCALAFRRRRPLATLVVIIAAIAIPPWIVPVALTYWGEFIPWLVAVYSCARHERLLLRALVALALAAATLASIGIRFPEMGDVGDVLYNAAFLAAAWTLGLFARSWAVYRDDALRAEVERAQAEERASVQERARIARELHDVIAHTITVIVVQAGGGRLAAARSPDAAVAALGQIEELGRDSLRELRALLTVLHGEEDDGGAPQPTLGGLGDLCDRMRRLGLPVSLAMPDRTDSLPLGLQLTAYRVVQEGLTNVLKHSGAVDTEVRLGFSGPLDELLVTVVSAAGADVAAPPGAGRGLAGLRERVELMGGDLTSREGADGSFTLSARLPLRGEAT
jgi:signal transduction histidine kinase